jgi:Holliday junction resolvase RusA-like endonuclease
MTAVAFTVHGVAAPAGSKRGFYNQKAKRVIITDDSRRSRPWKAQVSDAAAEAMEGQGPVFHGKLLDGPLSLRITFYMPRPKGHFRSAKQAEATGRPLRPSAPAYPTVKPDVSKLVRAVEDALTGVVWRDDAQVVTQFAAKLYGEPARCDVLVEPAGAQERRVTGRESAFTGGSRWWHSLYVLRQRGQLPGVAAKARWLYWRHVRRYDYEVCHRCGRPVLPFTRSWWHADDLLWARAGGVHYGILCPPCFTIEADAGGIQIRWEAVLGV